MLGVEPDHKTAPDDCVNTSVLVDRGWTPAAIRRFLSKPDRTWPVNMYSLARAIEVESTEDWKFWDHALTLIAEEYPGLVTGDRHQAAKRRAGFA